MIDKSTEVKHQVISFAIREDQEMELFDVYQEIDELVSDNKKVPADLLKRFISLLHDPSKIYESKFVEKISVVIEKYKHRFSTEDSAFMFYEESMITDPDQPDPIPDEDGSEEDSKPKKLKVVHSWEEMIKQVSNRYLTTCVSDDELRKDKGATIKYFTRQLNNYLQNLSENIQSKMLLSYRRAIVGWLCIEVRGFKICDQKTPTVKQLAAKARYEYNLEMAKKQERTLSGIELLLKLGRNIRIINGKDFKIVVPKRVKKS